MIDVIDVIDAGDGWRPWRRRTAVGVVRAVFRRAVYLDVGDGLLAVCDANVPSGPIHLRVRRLPALVPGESVTITDGRLLAAAGVVDLNAASPWHPPPLDADGLAGHRRTALATLAEAHVLRSRRTGDRYAVPSASSLRRQLATGDLVGAARLLGGRGPGLTPAGDDVLAGILVVSAIGPDPVDPAVRAAAAVARPTTAVARAFLHWAARGESIAPVHNLLGRLSRGDGPAARRALADLCRVGASSGADLALGLELALAGAQDSTRTTSSSGPRASVFDT